MRFISFSKLSEMWRFGWGAVPGTALYYGLYNLLVFFDRDRYMTWYVVAFALGSTVTFIIQKNWTFRNKAAATHQQVLKYLIFVTGGSFLLVGAMLNVLVEYMYVDRRIAPIICLVAQYFYSLYVSRRILKN